MAKRRLNKKVALIGSTILVLVVVGAMLRETPDGGAGHVGALFFGWAFVLLWFAPWLLGYAVIQFFRRRHASRNT